MQHQKNFCQDDNNRACCQCGEVYPVSITLRNLIPVLSFRKRKGVVGKYYASTESSTSSTLLLHESTLEVYYKCSSRKEEVIVFKCHHKAALHPKWDIDYGRFFSNSNCRCRMLRVRIVVHLFSRENETVSDVTLFRCPLDFYFGTSNSSLQQFEPALRPLSQKDGEVQETKRLSALPPNSLFVEYSNGLICVNSSLYALLIKNEVVFDSESANFCNNQTEIFSESAFQKLDEATKTEAMTTTLSTIKLQETDHDGTDDHHFYKALCLTTKSNGGDHLMTQDLQVDKNKTNGCQQTDLTMQHEEEAVINEQLKQQIDILEDILEKQLEEVQQLLLCTPAQENDDEEESILTQEQLDALLEKETFALKIVDITLETRQVKLLRQLRDIYPIEKLSDTSYAIRGLELSLTELQNPQQQLTEDALVLHSSALGFVVHLVTMTSKYLNIPLRYRLLCNCSRSAVVEELPCVEQQPQSNSNVLLLTDNTNNTNSSIICDGFTVTSNTIIYPLFREKKRYYSEHDNSFHKGLVFLERNIECLLDKRCIAFSPKSHMYAQLIPSWLFGAFLQLLPVKLFYSTAYLATLRCSIPVHYCYQQASQIRSII